MNANRAFCILLATFTISFTGLTTLLIKSFPLTISHAIYICQRNLSNVAFILPHSLPFILTLIGTIVLTAGFLILAIQISETRIYIRKNIAKRIGIPRTIKTIIKELNLASKIDVVEDSHKFSFCYGIVKPRICLSTSLITNLNSNELKTVLFHESYHLKNYDPLKIIIGKAASYMFFFIPILKDVDRYFAFSKEIAADNLAIKNGGKKFLLSAFSKLIATPTPKFSGVAALANTDELERRIQYLAGQQGKILFRPSLLNLALSVVVLLVSTILLNAPVHAFSMNDDQMNQSYFFCPYGDKCANDCKKGLITKEVNFSENRLYTPVEGH